MSLKMLVSILPIAALGSGAAWAFEISGAEVSLEYRANDAPFEEDQLQAEGNLAVAFGSGIGLQFGVKNTDYEPDSFNSIGYELHATYAVSEQVTLGAFYGREDFDGFFKYVGVEADARLGRFGVQASVSEYSSDTNDSFEETYTTLLADYAITDRFSVHAGYHFGTDDGGEDDTYAYIGTSAKVFDGVAVTARYGELGGGFGGQEIVTLGISYSFKGGVIFDQRTYTNMFPTD